MMSDSELGYLKGQLEGVNARLDRLTDSFEKHTELTAVEMQELKKEIAEYTGHWKAVRTLGAVLVAIIAVLKTGSLEPLRALLGGS